MAVAFQVLNNTRINGVYQGLLDPRLLPQELVWSQRIPDMNAVDGDIMARYIGYVQIADMVADDQRAAVYTTGKFQFEATTIPNLKVGQNMTQSMINQWDSIEANGGISNDEVGIFQNSESVLLANVLLGVRWRKEALLVAMLCDSLTYDRLGIKMQNATWGMPSDLKVTVSTGWDNSASATPVNDIWTVRRLARIRYGIDLNRASMSTQAFQYMITTTEFQNKARMYLAPNVSFVNINTSDTDTMRGLAQNVLQMQIELYDARYQTQATDGTVTFQPFLPVTKVILTAVDNDRKTRIWDFANGKVTEATVSKMLGNPIAGGQSYGPLGYGTPASLDLNPPGLVYWGVQRGFPRKHVIQSNAVLTVGQFTDTIPVTAPF